jgi:steroid 5-alpha reductase family enzyme
MILYFEALAAIGLSLSLLMAGAWMIQQLTGNSGWVDTIWTFSLGLVGAGSALWPVAGSAPNARQWLVAALVGIWSLRLGLHIAVRTKGMTDDPRYAAFAREWGVDSPRKMFLFLQNQGLGSIPLVFSIFVAAHFPLDLLRPRDYLAALILLSGIAGEALATQAFPEESGQSGPGLRHRPVALVAPSQLFFRMAGLARLSRHRAVGGLPLGLGNPAGAGLHVLDPGACHRHPAT